MSLPGEAWYGSAFSLSCCVLQLHHLQWRQRVVVAWEDRSEGRPLHQDLNRGLYPDHHLLVHTMGTPDHIVRHIPLDTMDMDHRESGWGTHYDDMEHKSLFEERELQPMCCSWQGLER